MSYSVRLSEVQTATNPSVPQPADGRPYKSGTGELKRLETRLADEQAYRHQVLDRVFYQRHPGVDNTVDNEDVFPRDGDGERRYVCGVPVGEVRTGGAALEEFLLVVSTDSVLISSRDSRESVGDAGLDDRTEYVTCQ